MNVDTFVSTKGGKRMGEEVLKIITENLTNERLDGIITQKEEYKQAEKEENQIAADFERMLNQEQFKAYNHYLTAENQRISVYITLCYQQGMKDIVKLLMSLAGEQCRNGLSIPLPLGTLGESGDLQAKNR